MSSLMPWLMHIPNIPVKVLKGGQNSLVSDS